MPPGGRAGTLVPGGLLRMSSVFVSVRSLPESCQPCHVTRHRGMTLWMVQPGVPKLEAIGWAMEHLTEDELAQIRLGLGQPPAGLPLDDVFVEGMVADRVPASLRLPERRSAFRPFAPRPEVVVQSEAG